MIVVFGGDIDNVYVSYITLGDEDMEAVPPRFRTMTAYRLLVTVSAICFGTTKAYLSLRGETTVRKALEWVYSAVVSLV
jgi:hypothetical protein